MDAFTHGWILRVIGQVRSGAEVLHEAAAAFREVDFYRHLSACLGELAHCYALLGDVGAAEAALADADASRVGSFVMDFPYVEGARAWTVYAGGEHSRARQIAVDSADRCLQFGYVAFAAGAYHDVARLGDPAAAVEPLTR